MPEKKKLVVMGVITAAHGIRGEVKLKSFTANPEDIAAYGPLLIENGPRVARILSLKPARGQFIARLEGIDERTAAEALKGKKLKLERARLPEPEEEEFYYSDLIGLKAVDGAGRELGEVAAVHDFGAGDLLEIRPRGGGKSFFLPFTREAVPEIDIAGGAITICPPGDDETEEP